MFRPEPSEHLLVWYAANVRPLTRDAGGRRTGGLDDCPTAHLFVGQDLWKASWRSTEAENRAMNRRRWLIVGLKFPEQARHRFWPPSLFLGERVRGLLGGSCGQFDPNTLEPLPFGGLRQMAPSAGEKAHNGHRGPEPACDLRISRVGSGVVNTPE
jgi:hypothetical protein